MTPDRELYIDTFAGGSRTASFANNVDASELNMLFVTDLAVDDDGNVYVADSFHDHIIRIDRNTNVASRVVGHTSNPGFTGDGGLARNAKLDEPSGIDIDAAGNLYIADSNNHRIRKVDASTGIITTIVGTGVAGTTGDFQLAVNARINRPRDVVATDDGLLYFSSQVSDRIRIFNGATGQIRTVAGGGTASPGDGGVGTAARLFDPNGLTIDANGDILFAETGSNVIRKLDGRTERLSTIAGARLSGSFAGDGGPAASGRFDTPTDVHAHPDGSLLIVDSGNARLRRIDPDGVLSSVAGTGIVGLTGDGGRAFGSQIDVTLGRVATVDHDILAAGLFAREIRRIYDAVDPEVTFDLPATARRFGTRVPVDVVCEDAFLATCAQTLDGQTWPAGRTIPVDRVGTRTARGVATDASGNQTIIERQVTIDWRIYGTYAGASGNEGIVVRFYVASFGRLPDVEGFNFWVNRLNADPGDPFVPAFFVDSDEFRATYGSLTEAEFLDTIYLNVLGRPPEAEGRAFWAGELSAGRRTRGQVMEFFAQSQEHRILTGTS